MKEYNILFAFISVFLMIGCISYILHNTQDDTYSIGLYVKDDISVYEKAVNYKFSTRTVYTEIITIDYGEIQQIIKYGRKPIITLEFLDPNGQGDRLTAILNGTYDKQLLELKTFIEINGATVQLRPLHEFNGDWYPWGVYFGTTNQSQIDERKELFKQTWIHVHDIVDSDLVEWQLNYNSNNGKAKSDSFESFYPGDDYVDYVSVSSFNRAYLNTKYLYWETFSERFDRPYNEIISFTNKTIAIAEVSSTSYGREANKPLWIYDTFHDIKYKYPRVKQITWFLVNVENIDARPGVDPEMRDWNLNSKEEIDAFKKGISLLKRRQ